jgi:hypothetical protein
MDYPSFSIHIVDTSRRPSSGMCLHVVWQKFTIVTEECAASISSVEMYAKNGKSGMNVSQSEEERMPVNGPLLSH